jgi:hypothetical protein
MRAKLHNVTVCPLFYKTRARQSPTNESTFIKNVSAYKPNVFAIGQTCATQIKQ